MREGNMKTTEAMSGCRGDYQKNGKRPQDQEGFLSVLLIISRP